MLQNIFFYFQNNGTLIKIALHYFLKKKNVIQFRSTSSTTMGSGPDPSLAKCRRILVWPDKGYVKICRQVSSSVDSNRQWRIDAKHRKQPNLENSRWIQSRNLHALVGNSGLCFVPRWSGGASFIAHEIYREWILLLLFKSLFESFLARETWLTRE